MLEIFSLIISATYILCLLNAQQRMDVKSLQEPCAGANDLLMLIQTDNLMDFAM